MNKIWDYIITTQMCTIIAALSMYGAHLLDKSGPQNWNFAVYILLFIGCMFMLLPYLFLEPERNRIGRNKQYQKEKRRVLDS